ncbi:MAG TPA: hypothetical protein PLA77_07145, partial [Bacteroidales bacterium]|nr:hypothetical protein [Bacteroidales bacterium]
MKRKTLIALALLMPMLSLAQERFYNLYEGWKINDIMIIDGLYYTYGCIIHPNAAGYLPQFNILHKSGTLLEAFTYYSDTVDGLTVYRSNSYLLRNNDTVIFVGSYTDYYKAYGLEPIMMKYNLETRTMDTIISYNHCVQTSNPQKAILYLIDTTETGFI